MQFGEGVPSTLHISAIAQDLVMCTLAYPSPTSISQHLVEYTLKCMYTHDLLSIVISVVSMAAPLLHLPCWSMLVRERRGGDGGGSIEYELCIHSIVSGVLGDHRLRYTQPHTRICSLVQVLLSH